MVNCKYTLKRKTYNSYTELLNYLDRANLELKDISDIVYSKISSQQVQSDKIRELKANYTPRIASEANITSLVSGEPSVKGAMSIIDFIDSPSCVLPSGRALITPLSREDYIKRQIDILSEEMSREDAEKAVAETVANWDKIQRDSLALHNLFTNNNIQSRTATDIDFINDVKGQLPDSLNSTGLLTELFTRLKHNYMVEKGKQQNA